MMSNPVVMNAATATCSSTGCGSECKLIINELLAYLCFYLGKSSRDNFLKCMLFFFTVRHYGSETSSRRLFY